MLLAAFSVLAAAMRLAPLRMTSERPPAARLAPLRMSELPPLDDKWAVQKLKEGVRLASKDLHFRTEDESIEVPRSPDSPGIGLALEEVGSDGTVGLVLVDSVVDDLQRCVQAFCRSCHAYPGVFVITFVLDAEI
mgnify:CR=1 FL=1